MSVLWEKLAGNTDRFAFKVAFQSDPDQGAGASVEQTASWGAFQIWVQGRNLCAHLEEGEVVESVHWYLLSLFEWLARNWDPLLHEERLPVKNAGANSWESLHETRFPPPHLAEDIAERWDAEWSAWWARHAWQSCREGGLFPDLILRRWRDKVEWSWGESPCAGAGANPRFTAAAGAAWLEPLEVARPLFEVLRDAALFLKDRLPESGRIAQLINTVESLRVPRDETRLAWLAGLGRTGTETLERWRRVVGELTAQSKEAALSSLEVVSDPLVLDGSCHAALMFGSLSPTVSETDVVALARELLALHVSEPQAGPIERLAQEKPLRGVPKKPHEEGYELAEEVLDALGLAKTNEPSVDVAAVLAELGVSVREIHLRDASIRAVAVAGEHHRAAVLLNTASVHNQGEAGQRFTLAHELCHLLFDRSKGRKLALASGPWAPIAVEQRARAFAAMFLMPPVLVRRALDAVDQPLESLDQLIPVARQLHTSHLSSLDHLYNLQVMDETVREKVRAEIDARAAAWSSPSRPGP